MFNSQKVAQVISLALVGLTCPAQSQVKANPNKTTETSTASSSNFKTLPPDTFFKANNVWSIDFPRRSLKWSESSGNSSSCLYLRDSEGLYSIDLKSGAKTSFRYALPVDDGVKIKNEVSYVIDANHAAHYSYASRERKGFINISLVDLNAKKLIKNYKFSGDNLNIDQEDDIPSSFQSSARFHNSENDKHLILHTSRGLFSIDTTNFTVKLLAKVSLDIDYFNVRRPLSISDNGYVFLEKTQFAHVRSDVPFEANTLRISPDGEKKYLVDDNTGKNLNTFVSCAFQDKVIVASAENYEDKVTKISCLSARDLKPVWTTTVGARQLYQISISGNLLYARGTVEKANTLFAFDLKTGKIIWGKDDSDQLNSHRDSLRIFPLGPRNIRFIKLDNRLCLEDVSSANGAKIDIMAYPDDGIRLNFQKTALIPGGGGVIELADDRLNYSKFVAVLPKKPGVKKLSGQSKDGIEVQDVSALK